MNIETNTFKVNKKNQLVYLTYPKFEETGIVNHCFSTKIGGVSQGIYESLNLGFNRGDDNDNVIKNYNIICDAIDIDYRSLVLSNQVHDVNIKVVNKDDRGKGIIRESDIIGIDGLITNESKVPLVTLYADCVPLFFVDPIKKAIGLSHSGWKGTVNRIAEATIRKMNKEYNSRPEDILVGIGPSIGPCCFEVGKEVVDIFEERFPNNKEEIIRCMDGNYYIDLWKTIIITLLESGINKSNIAVTDMCTKCNKEIFFSHRGHNGKRGSLAAFMELR